MTDARGDLERNLAELRTRIERAAQRSGRTSADVALVAVTKRVPPDTVRLANEIGVRDFGENYVNELSEKRPVAPDARWHFIGVLQSHTANRIAELADVVHSAAPGRALVRPARRAAAADRTIPVLLQIDEAGRGHGVRPERAEAAMEEVAALPGVVPVGLMSLPPPPASPEDSRPYFVHLRQLRDDLRKRFGDLVELSMGMSLDYEIAVEEGATMVRVGTALFGPRPG
jgi:pyridoxal phosphate enzyme (YggS family)